MKQSLKNSDNSINAEIEDLLNNIKKKGTEAFNELYPLVKQLIITQQTAKEAAIQVVMKVFDLSIDYTEFEWKSVLKMGRKLNLKTIDNQWIAPMNRF